MIDDRLSTWPPYFSSLQKGNGLIGRVAGSISFITKNGLTNSMQCFSVETTKGWEVLAQPKRCAPSSIRSSHAVAISSGLTLYDSNFVE
jgi:hypothetical protein